MKRYIRLNRLNDNRIIDTEITIGVLEEFNDKEYYYTQQSLKPLFCINDINAESDNIADLIIVGDLVQTDFYKTPLLVTKKGYGRKFGAKYLDLTLFKFWLDKNEEHNITQIYTKQGDNYILVWDEERGVI